MEKKLKTIYQEARDDIRKKWDEYMLSIKDEGDKLLKAYEDAKASSDKDLIKKTGKEYSKFLREKTITNQYYKDMLDETTTQLAHVNETALAYLNDTLPETYAVNYNQIKDELHGYSFALTDATTVKNLATTNKSLLPYKKLNITKDKRWNTKSINAQILQGIIQGESIDKMAKRLQNVTNMNEHAAIRNARTMTTSAENKGRLDSYKKAQSNGVILKKVWLSGTSKRTRDWHAELSGIEAEIDEPFVNAIGDIMYPGDPSADGANVYNCRCTLKTKIIGFRKADGHIDYVER